MTFNYTLWETPAFRIQFDGLPTGVQEVMSDDILKIKSSPYDEAHGRKPLIGNLDGFWRIHVGRIAGILYVVVYLVCENCRDRDFEEKFSCFDCFKHAAFHIKLVACGYRDGFYENLEENWQTWIHTANAVAAERD